MKKYIFGAVLSLSILISPTLTQASSLTATQISAIVSLLQSFGADQTTINNVQVSLNGGTPTSPGGTPQPWCHTFNTDLTIGSRGDEVSALHHAIALSDILSTQQVYTPIFDETMAGYVVQFQAKYGIRQTGYVGPLTRAKLNSLYGCPSTSNPLTIITDSQLPNAQVGQPYSVAINASGGDGFYSWSVNNGEAAFPVTGLGLTSTQGNPVYIKGTPAKVYVEGIESTIANTFTFTITATSGSKKFSKQFTLTVDPETTTTTPSITVLSPNGGEQFALGSTQTIKWSTQNFGTSTVRIALKKDNVYLMNNLFNSTVNDGTETWTVPSDLAPGNDYRIIVEQYFGLTNIYDESDAPFSIVADTSVSTPLTLTNITPSSGTVGTSIRLDGCGSDSASGFTLVYTGPKSGTAVIPVETLGAASGCGYMTITVPTDFPAGTYTLQVQNNQTGAMSTNSEVFTVTAPSVTNNPHLSLSASSIVQGDSLVTTVTGATPNTAFSIYANGPANTYSAGMTDASGQFSRTDSTVGLTVGTYSAWVTVNGVPSNTVSFTITARPASPATLTVTPSTASVQVGGTQQFIATYDPDGAGPLSPVDVTVSASWFASPSATVSKGLVTGQSSGDALINAIYSGITKSVSIHVTAPTPPAALTLTSISPASGPVGTSVRLDGCGSDSTSGFTLVYTGPRSGTAAIPVETLGAASGCGYMTITVPSDFPAGTYTLQVKNNQTGTMSTNSEVFTVTSPVVVNNPVASVSSTSFVAGTIPFGISITGAAPNSPIRIFSTGLDGVTSEDTPGTTNPGGQFSRSYNTTGWAAGNYRGWVTVNGAQSNTVTFTVTAPAVVNNPVASVSPASFVAGANFTSSITGAAPNAAVHVFSTGPDGVTSEDLPAGTTNASGQFSRTHTTTGWPAGSYRGWMTVNGVQSNTVTFTVGSVLGAFSDATNSFSYVWNRDLQIGSPYLDDITALQKALTREGVYAGEITGGFYNQTYTAVKAFQQKHGIEATGYVGPLTRAELNTLFAR